ncbi:2-oxo acid dehydrogenase subunit E2, partial [Streptomyces sp. NPDC127112]|uniref:2-oxo acid dehydrogenase subunit E2 n=1 Tax=Streptomyces sp. NPDC127112 TaxID=3345364 RepID=UPI003629D801
PPAVAQSALAPHPPRAGVGPAPPAPPPTVTATLSADHRATDGATGARFLTALDRLLQHPEDL